MNISGIDLNLLIVFEALLIERNVTRAAKRIGLAQSSMSGALSRLREVFDDELFVRSSGGMKPTKRALELEFFILEALASARKAIEMPKEFNLLRCKRKFVIGGTDFTAFTVLPSLIKYLAVHAPDVRLEIKTMADDESIEAVQKDQLDFAITMGKTLPQSIYAKKVFGEKIMVLGRLGHSVELEDLDLESYADLQHICVKSMEDVDRLIDAQLRKKRLKRRVTVRVQSFLIVPYLLEKSNCVATISERVASECCQSSNIRAYPFPGNLPRNDFYLIWGRMSHADQEVRWLINVVSGMMEKVDAGSLTI